MADIEKLREELENAKKKEMQARHRQMRLESTLSYMEKKQKKNERNARTHRLANKGGTIEHFFPETKDMSEEEFFNLFLNLMGKKDFRSMVSEQMKNILGGGKGG